MRIGILVCGSPPDEVVRTAGQFDQMFRDLLAGRGLRFVSHDVEHMDFPGSVHDAEGWLITGSRHGVYEDHAFIPPLESFLRRAHDARVPMVGICFGHQIMAQALGGRVGKFDGGWVVGRQSYDVAGLGQRHLTAWHQDQVLDPPPGAQVIATGASCRYAGLRYGDHGLSLQPHPEILGDTVKAYVAANSGTLPPALLGSALAGADLPTDHADMAGLMAACFQRHAV